MWAFYWIGWQLLQQWRCKRRNGSLLSASLIQCYRLYHRVFLVLWLLLLLCLHFNTPLHQKHEQQAQQHFQHQLRRRREEELQRQAEQQAEARQESEHRADAQHQHQHQHHHDKASGGKAGDKPKRPSSLLGNNNVMKLKQIIPLQGKFSSGTSRSPAQSPTGGEAKLPGFLKFLKSPEVKKEPAVAAGAQGSTGTSASPSTVPERSQSPNRTFSPGKLFSFSKSEGTVVCVNGTQAPPQRANAQPSRGDLNSSLEELPSNESDKGDSRQLTDSDNSKS